MANFGGNFGQVVPASSTVEIWFTTNSAAGAAVAPLSAFEAGDVKLYKDHTATPRSSTSGWTMTSPINSVVGQHQLSIDLSDNTDAGFYAAGHVYTAILNPDTETVDGQTVVSVIGQFQIGTAPASIAAGDIANAAITAAAIADGAIDAATFAAGAIDASAIASNAITSAKIATGAITAAGVAAGAIVPSVLPAGDLGDYAANDTLNFTFGTDGTLGGSPVISMYKASSQTQVTTGITLDVDYDGVTGLNHVTVVLTDAFYAVNNDYMGVITTGTVGGVSVVGTTVVTFSIQKKTVKQVGSGGGGGSASADVNVVSINQVACTGVTAVNANQGTTQPVNFTGTGGSALVKGDTVDIAGTASAGAAGKVAVDLTQAVPTSNTAQTVGDALNAARAQGFGPWSIVGSELTLFAADGTTPVKEFDLDDPSSPTERTNQ